MKFLKAFAFVLLAASTATAEQSPPVEIVESRLAVQSAELIEQSVALAEKKHVAHGGYLHRISALLVQAADLEIASLSANDTTSRDARGLIETSTEILINIAQN